MINCRNCIHWQDESLDEIQANRNVRPHIFMGCRIFGFLENNSNLTECRRFVASENLFTVCTSCRVPVPKVCVSLGECANCTDTDLFCVDHCMGGDSRKYCTHFVRLNSEGIQIIDNDRVFDLFPSQGLPGKDRDAGSVTSPKETGKDE